KKQGYEPITVFLPEIHIDALKALESSMSDNPPNASKISYWVWSLIKNAIEGSNNADVLKLADDPDWPEYSLHELAQLNATLAFDSWTKEQSEEMDNK
ncbi:MAG: hypothetical protein JAY74_03685, partial [Candidatus Thiodiazotropha taylori]|nr:hypothetical protein [Candidatus Thiodiazotropha taylori]